MLLHLVGEEAVSPPHPNPTLGHLQSLSEPAPVSRAGWHLASAAACFLPVLLVLIDP